MRTRLEAAVAHEILAEVNDQGRTFKWVQERSGVKSRAWGYYFKGDRPIPFPALAAVCEVLGVKPSEMLARAEARVAATEGDPIAELVETMRDPAAREAAERAIAESDARRAQRDERANDH